MWTSVIVAALILIGIASGTASSANTDNTIGVATPPLTAPATSVSSSSPTSTPPRAPATTASTTRRSANTAPPNRPAHPAAGTALAQLTTLPVKGRAPKTGYSRGQFGPAWDDNNNSTDGHNGCDTRNDILARDLVHITYGSGHCTIASGILRDPYSGTTITFTRGATTSDAVQIDHVVALSNAWQTGAQQLSYPQRVDYANDPDVLLAVNGPSNEQKGDGDAATWLPPNKPYRCSYVARQVAIKHKYHLWVTPPEHDAIARILATCPTQPATVMGAPLATPPPHTPPPPAATPAHPPAPAPTTGGGSVYYPNCAAARAAGKAPLYRGQPGYRAALDRDGDGVACE